MNHHTHLALALDPHSLRCIGVVDFINHLNLTIVVAGAERPQLRQATLLCPCRHFAGIRIQHTTKLFAMLLVLRPSVPFSQRPVHPKLQRFLQVVIFHWDDPLRSHAHRNVVKQGLGQPLLDGLQILLHQVGTDQPYPAIDVETDTTWTHHRFRISHIQRGDVPDGETIPRVDIRQPNGVLHNTWEPGHIPNLLHSRNEASSDTCLS
mmetsp:Transcript_33125/g.69994  ORF Transcript_33125/g.69994 Transcript_33125/m.69994 type:complete len:207 (-) Transcript_33125:221-841(-)